MPVAESCNGKDDDCDGMIDNDCCDPKIGSCPSSNEICDGYDNDLDGKTDALDDVLYEADGVTVKSYRCCPDGKVDNQANADGIDNDCDESFDEVPGCIGQPEMLDGIDNNCNGKVDEGVGCPGMPETCDGVDQDCDGLVDNGLCCQATWNSTYQCDYSTPIGSSPIVHDSGIETSAYGTLQIRASGIQLSKYLGSRYVLPMKKLPGKKNRWYWELAVSYNNTANECFFGIGTTATPMVLDSPISTSLFRYDASPTNNTWAGAVVSLLLDLNEGKLRYWLNGTPLGPTYDDTVDPNEAYYPMTWIYSNYPDAFTHNFGPNFTYDISDLYDSPAPIP